jgi:P-type conjugative transfer protein TrbJ
MIFMSASHAGIPVIDAGNLVQNVVTSGESVTQTLKQIQQYRTQLQQYQNMLQNTVSPPLYIWDKAQETINSLREAQDNLEYHRRRTGSLNAFLGKYRSLDYYRRSPCYSLTGCTDSQRGELDDERIAASDAQKRANDALFKGLDLQQQGLARDAKNIERLQANAQSSKGQLEAIQYANQFASAEVSQLMQLRNILLTQNLAVAAKMQGDADLQAQLAASRQHLLHGAWKPSPAKKW